MAEFKEIELTQWRQFDYIKIYISSQVTVLTGGNGSGKTTVLNLLSRHFGWNWNFISTPWISEKTAKKIWSDLRRVFELDVDTVDSQQMNRGVIGWIKYADGNVCELISGEITSPNYQPEFRGLRSVEGLHIPSHRPAVTYHSVDSIPTAPITAAQQYEGYLQMLSRYYTSARTDNPGKVQKQSLISLALLGEGNSNVAGDVTMNQAFRGFQEALRITLPQSLGFQKLEIRMPEVIMVCDTGSFPIDAMSGGVSAIFSMVWQIYMFGQGKPSFSITIDEPENHLHPSLQRKILPSLSQAFPQCKFIVATHSPFIATSFPEASVFALSGRARQGVTAKSLSEAELSGTPNEVLRTIFEVDSNLPVWVQSEILRVLGGVQGLPDEQKAAEIMRRLAELGLADSILEYREN
jgi:predicted ATPase